MYYVYDAADWVLSRCSYSAITITIWEGVC